MASCNALSGYRVGEISQALRTKQKKTKTDRKENVELNALFSSSGLFQPEFVAVAPKVSQRKEVYSFEPCVCNNLNLSINGGLYLLRSCY